MQNSTKQKLLDDARSSYSTAYNIYRKHLVSCVGEEKSHGSTTQFASEPWYQEHCRLWQIQSEAQSNLYRLEQEFNKK